MSDRPDDFDYGEQREDGQYEDYPTIDDGEFVQAVRAYYTHTECGSRTHMSKSLAESVARNPEYYTKTYCAGCQEHVPVSEVEWGDGEDWVVDGDTTNTDADETTE